MVYRSKQFNLKVMIIINDAPYGSEKAYNALRLAPQTGKYNERILVTSHRKRPGFDILRSAVNGALAWFRLFHTNGVLASAAVKAPAAPAPSPS